MKIAEQVAYIRGLMDGLNPKDDDTTKIIHAIVDVLENMADAVEEIDDAVNDLDETVGGMAESLDLFNDFLSDNNDCDDCEDCDNCDDCDACDCCEDDDYFTITCPKCSEVFCVDEEIIDEGRINCPNCNELLEFDLSEDDFEIIEQ